MHQFRPKGWPLLVPPSDQVCFVSTNWVTVLMSSLYYFSSSITCYRWNSSEDGGDVEETEPSEMLGMHLVQNTEGFPRALLRTVTFNGVVCGHRGSRWGILFQLGSSGSLSCKPFALGIDQMMIQQCSFQHGDLHWNLRLFCMSESAHHLACQTYLQEKNWEVSGIIWAGNEMVMSFLLSATLRPWQF